MKTGMIFDLKRFAVHDGGGLRSTLFLKGCPLRCPWCQNPEGLEAGPLVWYAPTECLGCGSCVRDCPQGALHLGSGRVHMDRSRCVLCGECEAICPAAALQVKGRRIDAREAADLLLRDRLFFEDGGGVTLSGGECLAQWEFAWEVLSLCAQQGVDTAIETCLLAPRRALEAMLEVTDHFLVDIKYLDGATHKRVVGADNQVILDNYRFLADRGADVLVRTPLIPGYTATEENIRSIARFLRQVDPQAKYELLNFNPLCKSKYEALEVPYPVECLSPYTQVQMDAFYQILQEEGIACIVRE